MKIFATLLIATAENGIVEANANGFALAALGALGIYSWKKMMEVVKNRSNR